MTATPEPPEGNGTSTAGVTGPRTARVNEEQLAELTHIITHEVEPFLLGGSPHLSRADVVEVSGMPLEHLQALWIGLGFPMSPDPEMKMFTDSDIEALSVASRLVERGIISESVQLAMARTIGQTMSRLAEWQVDVVSSHILETLVANGDMPSTDEIRDVARDVTQETVPALQSLLTYTWRRHLAATAGRSFAGGGPSSLRKTLVVGFADMVGYTRLTRHIDEDELNELLEAFESNASAVIAKGNGWIVKNVGDEVMFATESPVDAANIALELQESTAAMAQTPQLRVGLACGPVLQRYGDLYGSVVNLASRLTGIAHPGTVLIDNNLGEALDADPTFELRHLKSIRVRGFNRLKAHSLRRG